jgi:ribosome-associated translation inhibitor RaiA
MQIDIQSSGFYLTESLLSYAQRRLLFALSYCSGHVKRVVIRLSDVNGPRGGTDKHCHIQVALTGLADVVAEDTGADMYAAIDCAINRARRTVVRKVDQQLSLFKQREPLNFKYRVNQPFRVDNNE